MNGKAMQGNIRGSQIFTLIGIDVATLSSGLVNSPNVVSTCVLS